MIDVGIVRKTDPLGRIVVPKELRRTMNIVDGTAMEILVEDDLLILRKYSKLKECVVTGEVSEKNREYPGGVVLSPAGAEILREVIKEKLH